LSGIFYERFGHNKLAMTGSVLVALLFLTAALLAPVIPHMNRTILTDTTSLNHRAGFIHLVLMI